MVIPSPFVYWAQTSKHVSLRIDLRNAETPEIEVVDSKIKFSAEGVAAHGICRYEFSLDLYSDIKSDEDGEQNTTVKVYENRIDVLLQKEEQGWWPRLTAQPQKPAWLKINFDLWKTAEDEVESEIEEETRDVMKDYPGMYDELHKEELGYKQEEYKKVYLIIYNLVQWIGFTYVVAVMCARYAKLAHGSVPDTYEHVGAPMKFLHLMMFLEVMHPLFGYTRGSPIISFMQIGGRAFVLFAMIEAEPRMQTKPVVFYLFIMWTVVEVVRYPYYIAQLYNKSFSVLTWLRYSLWIPLYPLGIVCEAIVILRNIPYYEETGRFTVSLPNDWNFAFHMPSFMRLYLLVLTFPGMFLVVKHMYHLRVIKLRPKIIIQKCK